MTILKSDDAPLSSGRKYVINCTTVGSRPPAKISWYMEGQLLTNYTEQVSLACYRITEISATVV